MGVPTVDVFDLPAFAPEHRGGPRECADKLLSEAAEVFAEVRSYCALDKSLAVFGGVHREYIALELADVLQVVRNICAVCEITPALMAHAMNECVIKNNEKDGGRY